MKKGCSWLLALLFCLAPVALAQEEPNYYAIMVDGKKAGYAIQRRGVADSKVTSTEEFAGPEDRVHKSLADLQEKTALLPDYDFKSSPGEAASEPAAWPAANAGTSVSGLAGGFLTLGLAGLVGLALKARRRTA